MNAPEISILDIYIGSKCNLTCYQCDTRSDIFKDNSNDPELDEILEGIDLARKKFKVNIYGMLGGEPLYYLDRVEKIVKFIRSYDQTATIVLPTNGTLLEKKMDKVVELVKTYNISVAVCDHFASFEDRKLSNKIEKAAMHLVERLGYTPIGGVEFFKKNIINVDKAEHDQSLKRFLEYHPDITLGHEKNLAYGNYLSWIWFRPQYDFHPHYRRDENNKPKPFMTNDPTGSYFNGCCSLFCNFLNKKKLYKCAALGTLESFLKKENLLDDQDWQKYLAYKPLDLETCTDEEVMNFSNNKFAESSVCDMCPNTNDYKFIKTPELVLPKKIFKINAL
jgi:organic radical activating enzyme